MLFDKGRGAGGRMSTRRVETSAGLAAFDYGAQYFTVRDPAFQHLVQAWQQAGVAAPWPAAGLDAFVGVPTMNAPVKALASGLDVRFGVQVGAVVRQGSGWLVEAEPFDAVVVATSAEQAVPLLAPRDAAASALAAATVAAPCWTLMAAFETPVEIGPDVLRGAASDAIAWAARNSAKPGRDAPEAWVVQASAAWSRSYLELAADEIVKMLLREVATRTQAELPGMLVATAHRWRYAKSGAAG